VNLVPGVGYGFRRRSDDQLDMEAEAERDGQEGVMDGDLMAEFSELNYQLAKPEPESKPEQVPPMLGGDNLDELQRLISNLQQLQQLNVSLDLVKTPQSQADAIYLQSQLQGQQLDTSKTRRQSLDNSSNEATTTATSTTTNRAPMETEDASTTQSPTRISLNLGLSDADEVTGDATTTTEASSSSSTTEESRNGSLDDLADSFGPDPVSEEPPPPKKKNGFYFLADWNSFLEVGDGDDQVVVRLSPKIGDPRDFLPV